MSRKERKVQLENDQRLANQMLSKSQSDAEYVVEVKRVFNDVMARIQTLNKTNNFSARVELAYRGQS